jgi:hypothetical protein
MGADTKDVGILIYYPINYEENLPVSHIMLHHPVDDETWQRLLTRG